MEELDVFVNRLKAPSTGYLPATLIQEVLIKARCKILSDNDREQWTEISDILWMHLNAGLIKFDDQLLCSTCFYTILSFTNKQDFYLEQIHKIIEYEITVRSNTTKDVTKASKTSLAISLMYGMFQSTFLVQDSTGDIKNILAVLDVTIELLITMAYDYSRHTFLAFKTINAFNKVLGLKFQENVYCEKNVTRILNVVNHNWENPITGVRDLNKSIFKTLVGLLNKDLYDCVLKEINNFQWNKAKYLMLAEIIEQNHKNVVNFKLENSWIEGIMYSLQKPGLVSAGADMYFAILKNLNSEGEWCILFFKETTNILLGSNKKAIENFGNYWCLTTFKRFPWLLELLIQAFPKFNKTELAIFSNLCIVRQGNKLGLLNKLTTNTYEETKDLVLVGLDHRDPQIRMLAFEILSITQGKSMPNPFECNLILDYLQNNINSDCTVLRISMLNNFKCFITKLNESFQTDREHKNEEIINFYRKLQELIVQSLKVNGNYQRKITTLKLCYIFLSSMNQSPNKQQKGKKLATEHFITILTEKDCMLLFQENFINILFSLLKDPADDIREGSVQLILDHYSKEITPILMNNLIEEAQNGIQSKFFYQISNGQSTFKLLASLFLKENFKDAIFTSLDDIFTYAFNELHTEYNKKRNIVRSIEAGKQLHSLLGVLLEILKISKQNSYEINSAKEKIPELIQMLEDIASQFTWEEETATSSDFCKMNEMIQNMIISSGYNPLDEKDSTKISGLQQIVLNCLWFNVKASCDLASFLLQILDDQQTEECEKCLTILMHSLETSRHKGVIEAAGAALGRSIQYLTSLPDGSAFSNIPLSLLKSKLKELISYANMASVTRRGAGLSIMVHRIVSSDMKKGKPLFHYFMETILETCSNAKETPNSTEGQKDLPKAIYIHFLTRIVIDSSLASDMMFYSAELAEIAFDNLISPHWQIRNAALQLYGALIPKLIGQKKASGTDDETIATVACDEFRTHSPKLWRHIIDCLLNINTHEDIILAHSNAMPIVNVLANLAKRYNFSFDTTESDCDMSLFDSLVLLLGSPIFTVRRLSAKCIYNIYDFETIFDTLMSTEVKSENALHGNLTLVLHCYRNDALQKYKQQFQELFNKYSLLFRDKHSYICKQQFEEFLERKYTDNEIQETLIEAKCNKHAPGISHWAKSRFRKYAQHCQWEHIPAILEMLVNEQDFDDYCKIIFDKIKFDNVFEIILKIIASILIKVTNINESNEVWKILYEISLEIDFDANMLPTDIFRCLKNKTISYRTRYSIPFLANLAGHLTDEHLIMLSNIVLMLCDPETSDVDMRCIAALANNALAKAFKRIKCTEAKITAIKSAVILLQDEDEDVRLISTDFYKHISNDDASLHSYICLAEILDKRFLQNIFSNTEIQILCKEIELILSSYLKRDVDDYNPFSSDSKNIYFETEIVRQYLQNLK